jgi:SAM-dependent methyltransferase
MAVRDLVARAVSHPTVNEIQTTVLGRKKLEARLAPVAAGTCGGNERGLVVDVGGGSARSRAMWPTEWRYLSIDPDERMVDLDDDQIIERIVGSADHLPFLDSSVDVVLMQCVSHHLDDELWPRSLAEIDRILKPGGYFVFLDGVWSPRRWISRVFWRFDVGRYPRGGSELEHAISVRFAVEDSQAFTLVHNAILVTARPTA